MRDADLIGISSFMATRIFMDHQPAGRGIRVHGNYEVQHHATAVNLVAGVGSDPAVLLFPGGRSARRAQDSLVQPAVKRKVVVQAASSSAAARRLLPAV